MSAHIINIYGDIYCPVIQLSLPVGHGGTHSTEGGALVETCTGCGHTF